MDKTEDESTWAEVSSVHRANWESTFSERRIDLDIPRNDLLTSDEETAGSPSSELKVVEKNELLCSPSGCLPTYAKGSLEYLRSECCLMSRFISACTSHRNFYLLFH